MTKVNGCYRVEQGMPSPRDNTMGWRSWGDYETLEEAKNEAKKIGYSRVLYVEFVVSYSGGKKQS